MVKATHELDNRSIQRARAAYLSELFEPWSLRRLEARTGIGRSTLQSRLNGETPLTMNDIEILAPVIRMSPEELFSELISVQLPGLDSNQEPIGIKPGIKHISDYTPTKPTRKPLLATTGNITTFPKLAAQ